MMTLSFLTHLTFIDVIFKESFGYIGPTVTQLTIFRTKIRTQIGIITTALITVQVIYVSQ